MPAWIINCRLSVALVCRRRGGGPHSTELHCFAYPIPPNQLYSMIYRSELESFCKLMNFVNFQSSESRFSQSLKCLMSHSLLKGINSIGILIIYSPSFHSKQIRLSFFCELQRYFAECLRWALPSKQMCTAMHIVQLQNGQKSSLKFCTPAHSKPYVQWTHQHLGYLLKIICSSQIWCDFND